MAVEAYPLSWPDGWKRTVNHEHSRFKTSFGAARKHLFAELGRMGSSGIILSTSLPLRNDGMPHANMRPDNNEAGVAVYFQRNRKPMVFACDKYLAIADNLYAIAKTIEALRGIERWGASSMMERAFSGFNALPASTVAKWWDVLGVEQSATRVQVEIAYRKEAMRVHPDVGGTAEQMSALNAARDAAVKGVR